MILCYVMTIASSLIVKECSGDRYFKVNHSQISGELTEIYNMSQPSTGERIKLIGYTMPSVNPYLVHEDLSIKSDVMAGVK
jgi:hypothetical protein